MKLHLASENLEIQRLCQEVLSDLVSRGWTLHIGNSEPPLLDADLYVWDIQPGQMHPLEVAPSDRWRHFYLVSRSDLRGIREAGLCADANLLLKPVTKAALSAFFSEACEHCKRHPQPADFSPAVECLRADRDELLQCLSEANLRLQEYDHDRTNFLARAIHDFRAPLTAISGYCGLLLGDDLGDLTPQQHEVLERMQKSAKRLSRMATAMFQLSIAPRAELTLDLQERDVRECIHQALDEMLPLIQEKRISFNVDIGESPEPLFFEPGKLQQVIINLLDNACKFTPKTGSIDVVGYPYFWDRRFAGRTGAGSPSERRAGPSLSPNSYRVDIRDTGPGIPAAHLAKVFEEYTCYGGGGDRSGGGLGLAICRMIMTQHRGYVWAESSKEGARFSFVLPFHRPEHLSVVQRSDSSMVGHF